MCILEDTSADKTAVIFHPRVVWKLQRFFFFMIQMLPSFLLAASHSHSSKDRLLPYSQSGLFSSCPNRQAGRSLLYHSQNPTKYRPIRRRSLPGIRRLRRRFSCKVILKKTTCYAGGQQSL